ncbi:MAG: helix-turn-helix transcriptional regulator, partial [Gaiellaceae bacterium]
TLYQHHTHHIYELGLHTLMLAEDVHWADEATHDVLRLLGRRVESVPALLVASYRDDGLDRGHPLRFMLGELATGDAATRLKLAPLSREAVAELADAHDVDPNELFDKTGGNPFFVVETLAAGVDAVPETVKDAVLARAARLSPGGRSLLEAISVVPQQVEPWLLDALAGEVADRLDECVGSGMLTFEPAGVAFRHELARLAVEDSVAPSRALDLHRVALAALTQPPDGRLDLARLAHHAEAAGDVEAVLRFAPDAGARAAALGAHREAAAQYARALRFGDGLSASERAELLERRSRACYLTDDIDDAIEAIDEALVLRRALGDRLEEGESLFWRSEILWCPGRTAESDEAGRQAFELLVKLPPSRALARSYMQQGSVAHVASGLELARELDDVELIIRGLDVLGRITYSSGGSGLLEEALALARAHGRVELVGNILEHLLASSVIARQYVRAGDYVEEAVDYCSANGLELYRYYTLAYRARLELALGRWDSAAGTAATVLRIHRASILPRILALVVLGLVRARRGDPGYRDLLAEAWTLAEPTDEPFRMGPVAAARAEIAWLEGDRDGVAEATDRVMVSALKLGDLNVAGELAAWRRRAGVGLPADLAADLAAEPAAEPYSAQVAGDWATAAAFWDDAGSPYEAALARADSGEEDELRRALDELQQLGARRAAAIVASRLRERGARGLPRGPRPSTRRNHAELTARELEVLRLLADGLRNATIAKRLYLSPRTIENHVSSILRKLNVQTRGAAAAEAARLALLRDT